MFTKLIGAATLFTAGSLMAGGTATVGATPVQAFGAEAALTQAGECGAKEGKEEGKTHDKAKDGKTKDGKEEGKTQDKAKDGKAKDGKAKDGKAKDGKAKDGSCGKDKKDGSCGADKKK